MFGEVVIIRQLSLNQGQGQLFRSVDVLTVVSFCDSYI